MTTTQTQSFSLNVDATGRFTYYDALGNAVSKITAGVKNTVLVIDLDEATQQLYSMKGYDVSPVSTQFSKVNVTPTSITIADENERSGDHQLIVLVKHKTTGDEVRCDPQVRNDPPDDPGPGASL